MYIETSIKDYLDELSSDKPTPGGGGTSALVAALGISLAIMVARIAIRKLEQLDREQLNKAIELLEKLRKNAEETVDLDPKVYEEVMASYKHAKNVSDPEQAAKQIETALANSFRLQADLALLIAMAKELLNSVGAFAKGSIRNDLIVSSGLLDGAFQGAAATARINIVYMKDAKKKKHFEEALRKVEQKFKKIKSP